MLNEPSWMHGGNILRIVRLKTGLTQEEVCLMSDIKLRTYQDWERLVSEPKFGHVMQVCECAFKIDLLDAITVARETPI